jgi:hypothetical protein
MKSWKDKANELANKRKKVINAGKSISPINEKKLKLPNLMKGKIRR